MIAEKYQRPSPGGMTAITLSSTRSCRGPGLCRFRQTLKVLPGKEHTHVGGTLSRSVVPGHPKRPGEVRNGDRARVDVSSER